VVRLAQESKANGIFVLVVGLLKLFEKGKKLSRALQTYLS
jgi:hypothetical protein